MNLQVIRKELQGSSVCIHCDSSKQVHGSMHNAMDMKLHIFCQMHTYLVKTVLLIRSQGRNRRLLIAAEDSQGRGKERKGDIQ